MNTSWIILISFLTAAHLAWGDEEKPSANVHEFRSKSGTTMKATVLGLDEDGKVLLQPHTPRAVAMESLRPEDQEFVKAEQERLTKEAEFIRQGWLDLNYADPGISILKDSMRLLGKDGKWEPYEPKDVTQLEYVAYYFNKEFPEDRFIEQLSSAYKKLRKRSPHVEVVYISIGDSDKAVRDYVESKKFEFPVYDPSLKGLLRTSPIMSHFKNVYPQLIVVDRQGQLKANSFKGANERSDARGTLDTLEKLARETARKKAK